eukprot:GSMAST32.ASY1.ANO1.1900.1 assembled CDS
MSSITPNNNDSLKNSGSSFPSYQSYRSDGLSHLYVPPKQSQRFLGKHLKSIVYGGLDGILTTFAIVSAATGSGMGTFVILILGFSNKFADALSMGLGDTLSSMAEQEHILKEREREKWELTNFREGEIMEMVHIYETRGMSTADAELIVNLMADHSEFFVDIMMVEELGMKIPTDDDSPLVDGIVTFCSFVFFGFLPLITYCIFPFAFPSLTPHELFLIASSVTAFALFLLGVFKAQFSSTNALWSGLEITLFGGIVAAIAYSLASVAAFAIGVHPNQL